MTREEFIGKLQMCYFGERNAFNEIISEYDSMINLNNQLVEECQRLDDEETRLNNIINRIGSFVNRTIEVIKQQPSGNDEWILERLNGIKYLTELKEGNKDE